MPGVDIAAETFRRLSERGASLYISIEALDGPALDRLAEEGTDDLEPPTPLSGDAWRVEFEAWRRDSLNRAARYPAGFVVDDGRHAIYREREDAQR